MKTNFTKKGILVGAALLAGVILVLFLKQRGAEPGLHVGDGVTLTPAVLPKRPSGPGEKGVVSPPGTTKPIRVPAKTTPLKRVKAGTLGKTAEPEAIRPVVDPATALKSWEDRLTLYTEEGAKERAKATPVTVKEQEELRDLFSDLSPEAQIENIHHAMNLLPDETVEVVFGILFDTSQSPEVLNAIFHDVLNRDEAIKNPMMETIAKDKTHPMYVESARILDIVKEK
jgi:hypothetical protein